MRYRKKRVAMLVAGFIGICSAITLSMTDCSSCSHQEPEKEEIPQTHLNDTLTNCMSDAPALEGMEKELKRYFERWELNGAQIAVSRGDSLLYAKGFGWADKEAGQEMQPSNIMRLASVSKLLTAVGTAAPPQSRIHNRSRRPHVLDTLYNDAEQTHGSS